MYRPRPLSVKRLKTLKDFELLPTDAGSPAELEAGVAEALVVRLEVDAVPVETGWQFNRL